MKKHANSNTNEKRNLISRITVLVGGALALCIATMVAFALTPIDGGMVTGTLTTVDNSPNDQTEPSVDNDLAAYTDVGTGKIRYFDFVTSTFTDIPNAPGDIDNLSHVSGTRISFSRQRNLSRACMVFDVTTSALVEIAPGSDVSSWATALGGDTVAFVDMAVPPSDIKVGKISAPTAPLASVGVPGGYNLSPAVSPDGEAVMWERCDNGNCGIVKSTFSAGSWSAAEIVSDTPSQETSPDTDGVHVVYDSTRPASVGGQDIYFQPMAAGPEVQIELPGGQRNPSVRQGVILFESTAPGAASDLFVYVINTNTVWQVTDTPTVNEILSDIDVLPNGDIRVIWAADDDIGFANNIYAKTLPRSLISTEKILFVTERSGAANQEIFVMDPDGSGQRNLFNPPIGGGDVTISPDGSKIAYSGDDVWVVDSDGSNPVNLTNSPGTLDRMPSFSPDGSQIVFASADSMNVSWDIWVVDVDGSNPPTRLTNDPQAQDMDPVFSPNGNKIAFTKFGAGGDIYLMDPDGNNQVNLTNSIFHDYSPAFSPDGSRIAYTSFNSGNYDIWVMNTDGSGTPTNLSNHPALNDTDPVFSPDGGRIAFVSDRDGNREIYVMNSTDGLGQTNLTQNSGPDFVPAWGFVRTPAGLTVNPSSLDFGQVPVEKTKDLVLTVTNTTAATITLSPNFTISQSSPYPFDASDFSGCRSTSGNILDPGASCTQIVRFWSVPGAGAASPATLRLFDGNTGDTLATVKLIGSVGPPDTGPNSPPIAVDDLSGVAPGIIPLDATRNDSDPDNDRLRIITVSDPPRGTASVISCGSLSLNPNADCIQYTSDAGYEGIDAIGYTISDGRGGTASATYHLAVGNNVVPNITAITPNSGPTSGGQNVQITGSNFLYGSYADFVCVAATLPLTITQRTDTEILATTPAGAPGACDLRVTTRLARVGVSANAYTYAAPTPTPTPTPTPEPDVDGDGIPDATDNCPSTPNAGQENNDGDAEGDACDADDDNDNIPDANDNCPLSFNPGQQDADADGLGNACDPDDDNDGRLDGFDNCPLVPNSDQMDIDGDLLGDACDPDDDNDGVLDGSDNCPLNANSNQADNDNDGLGDVCDADDDNDNIPDVSDNCPLNFNPSQTDTDADGLGNACDADDDNDGRLDGFDNCPLNANPNQENNDGDSQGDVCDTDDDNDGVLDTADNCPFNANPTQTDTDNDGIGDACDTAPAITAAYGTLVPSNGGLAIFGVVNNRGTITGAMFYNRGAVVFFATRITSFVIIGQTARMEGFAGNGRLFVATMRDGGAGQPDNFRFWIEGVEQTAPSGALTSGNLVINPWGPDTRLNGWVDLHTHPMSNLAFGGKLFHGAPSVGSLMPAVQMPNDPVCRKDERAANIAEALSQDAPTRGDFSQAECGDLIRRGLIFAIESNIDDANVAPIGAGGYPDFTRWPRWNDVTHQKMWIDWIRRSWQGGQRVMVALSHNNRTLAELLGGGGPISGVTNDKASSDLQIEEIKTLVAANSDFMAVAHTPAELHNIVQGGRLAVVLGVEIDKMGDFDTNAPPSTQLIDIEIDRLFAQGVRYILPVHLTDNAFGDTAIYEPLFNIVNYRENSAFWTVGCAQESDEISFRSASFPSILNPFIPPGMPSPPTAPNCLIPKPEGPFFTGHVNTRTTNGLTSSGEYTLRALMRRGIIIDIDHMSHRAANRTLLIANGIAGGGYPIMSGHTGIRSPLPDSPRNAENSRTTMQLARIACLGGMFGLGTDGARAVDWTTEYARGYDVMRRAFAPAPYGLCPSADPLGGTSFLGLGTDANSLTKTPRPTMIEAGGPPRFTDIYNPNNPINQGVTPLIRSSTGARTWDYNTDGVAHYGMFLDFLRDVRTLPASVTMNGRQIVDDQMMYGAERFYRMWLKADTQRVRVP